MIYWTWRLSRDEWEMLLLSSLGKGFTSKTPQYNMHGTDTKFLGLGRDGGSAYVYPVTQNCFPLTVRCGLDQRNSKRLGLNEFIVPLHVTELKDREKYRHLSIHLFTYLQSFSTSLFGMPFPFPYLKGAGHNKSRSRLCVWSGLRGNCGKPISRLKKFFDSLKMHYSKLPC